MGWAVLLPACAIWWVVNKRVNPRRGTNVVSVLTMLFAAIAGCGLAYTVVGRWIANGVSWGGQVLANLTGEARIVTATAMTVTLVVLLIALADILYDRRADKGAQFCAFLMPTLLFLSAGGLLHETGGSAVATVASQVASFFAQLGGA